MRVDSKVMETPKGQKLDCIVGPPFKNIFLRSILSGATHSTDKETKVISQQTHK